MATKDITDKQVCEAYAESRAVTINGVPFNEFPYQVLQRTTGQPYKVCYGACERAAKRGLVQYGVSLRTGWLTEAGKKLVSGEHEVATATWEELE